MCQCRGSLERGGGACTPLQVYLSSPGPELVDDKRIEAVEVGGGAIRAHAAQPIPADSRPALSRPAFGAPPAR